MMKVLLEGLAAHVEEAVIQSWFFEEGDPVEKGDELVEFSAGDTTIVLKAPASGILSEVYFDESEIVTKGEVLCTIDIDDVDES